MPRRSSPPSVLIVASLLWLTLTAAALAADVWLGLWMIVLFPALAFAWVGLVAVSFWRTLADGRRDALLTGVGLVVVAAALVAWGGQLGTIGVRLRFMLHRAEYEAVTAQVSAGARPRASVGYQVDPGPPPRVAFVWDGLGDNWNGVVWDPSGVVATARGWGERPGDYTASPEAKKLFGGDLVGCTHLRGAWYHCGFT
ncbi:hypothetical protein [Phenylobacterium sp.]|jgi:hypothetical protein|uniref:hypothetical protein n=1 Tax=Phenylobacterium sp. TaxID=1871053 RepID=UPI002F94BC4A